jgi:steroid delta-isomerase-like uncharacterized protein
MTDPTPRSIVDAWIAAYNAHDTDSIVSLYDEAASNTQWPWLKEIQGRAAIRATFERTFAAFPDIHVLAHHVVGDAESVALEWTFSGTMHGSFAGHPPTARRFTMRGCEVFQVRGGCILTQRGYWDKTTMFTQLGRAEAMPR